MLPAVRDGAGAAAKLQGGEQATMSFGLVFLLLSQADGLLDGMRLRFRPQAGNTVALKHLAYVQVGQPADDVAMVLKAGKRQEATLLLHATMHCKHAAFRKHGRNF